MCESQKDLSKIIYYYNLITAQGHFHTKTISPGTKPMTFVALWTKNLEATPSQKTLQQRGVELFSGGGCSH